MIHRTTRHESWPLWALVALIAGIGTCGRVAQAQEPTVLVLDAEDNNKPGAACGSRPIHPAVSDVTVACINWENLRKISPVLWKAGSETQVLVKVSRGDYIAVAVDGVVRYSDIATWPNGERAAMLIFDGINHETVSIRIFTEEK